MTIDTQTPWLSGGTYDRAKAEARFSGGAYDARTVAHILDAVDANCARTGLSPGALLGQCATETGWFRYGGDVQPAQYNFAGLGAVGGGAPGLSFPTPEAGVRGVVAHHGNYLFGAFVDWPQRWHYLVPVAVRNTQVLAAGFGGTVVVIGDYGSGKWAAAAKPGYGESIASRGNAVGAAPAAGGGAVATPAIVDLRGKLPTNPQGGAGTKQAQKRGQVLHFSAVNYAYSRTMEDILTSEAQFHIGPYLGEAGLAYHFCVDPQSGTVYQTRDEDDVLWHCGAWGTPGNADGLSIHVPGGSALVMALRALDSLCWLLGRNERKYGFKRAMLKGHSEVGNSSCPGPLMRQVVYPYRAGTLNWTGGGAVSGPVVDPVTGYTVHPDLVDTYDFAAHGRPLLPAVLYSDGIIRQLFERVVLEVGRPPGSDTVATLGQAYLYASGSGDHGVIYPRWPGIFPLT